MKTIDILHLILQARSHGKTVEDITAATGVKIVGTRATRAAKHLVEQYLETLGPVATPTVEVSPVVVAPTPKVEAPVVVTHRLRPSLARRLLIECGECGDTVSKGSTCWDTGLIH